MSRRNIRCHNFDEYGEGFCPRGDSCWFRHPPWSPPRTQRVRDTGRRREYQRSRGGRTPYEAPYPQSPPSGGRLFPKLQSRSPPQGRGRERESRVRAHTPEPSNPLPLLQRITGSAKKAQEVRRADESHRAEGSRRDAPKNIDPHRVVVERPRELAKDTVMPAEGSTPAVQPVTKKNTERAVEPAKCLDAVSSAETRPKPTPPLSQAPVASIDHAMEIEQPANPPENTLSGESNYQMVTQGDQEKMDATAKHRTVLKEIWERRVSYIDLIQLDTEVLRETQATIPLSVDQRQQLEDVVLSLQGRIQECTQRLFEDEVRLEQSLEMDKTHETALEDLTARLKRDEQAVQQWIEDTRRQYKTPVPEGVNPKRSRGRQEEINETIEALQNRLDDMHQLTTFDNDSFRDMVNVELDRYASRGMAKNVLEATELYSLDQLEEELKGLVEKLDESERKIRVLEAREEARAEELRKWMEEDARDEEQILKDISEAEQLNARTEMIMDDSPVASIATALQPYVDAWRSQMINALDYNILNSILPSRLNAHLEQLRTTQEEYTAGLAKLMSDQTEILEREKMEHTKRVVEQMMGVKDLNERIIEMLNADVARTSIPGP